MRTGNWGCRTLVVASLTLFSACDDRTEPPPQPAVLSERLGLRPAPSPKLPIGGDCTEYEGSTGCASEVCLRLTPGFPPRGVCSVRCGPVEPTPSLPDGGSTPADERAPLGCPVVKGEQWVCEQVLPRRTGFLCLPPRSTLGETTVTNANLDGGMQ
jgi:hypothetical protein